MWFQVAISQTEQRHSCHTDTDHDDDSCCQQKDEGVVEHTCVDVAVANDVGVSTVKECAKKRQPSCEVAIADKEVRAVDGSVEAGCNSPPNNQESGKAELSLHGSGKGREARWITSTLGGVSCIVLER